MQQLQASHSFAMSFLISAIKTRQESILVLRYQWPVGPFKTMSPALRNYWNYHPAGHCSPYVSYLTWNKDFRGLRCGDASNGPDLRNMLFHVIGWTRILSLWMQLMGRTLRRRRLLSTLYTAFISLGWTGSKIHSMSWLTLERIAIEDHVRLVCWNLPWKRMRMRVAHCKFWEKTWSNLYNPSFVLLSSMFDVQEICLSMSHISPL